jgi:hypothetical protein
MHFMDLEKLPTSVLESIARTIRQKYIDDAESDVKAVASGVLLEIKAILDRRAAQAARDQATEPGPDDERQDDRKG